jgi:hypothetical protein
MCSIEDGFRLCTCAEKINFDAEGIYWMLSRVNPSKELKHIKGKSIIPHYDAKEQDTRLFILAELNSRNCFDFPFEPQENDFLKIFVEQKKNPQKYCYQYTQHKWIVNSCDNLQGWKTQLDQWKTGKLE